MKKPLEQFPKSVKRFSDKNCGENKELEQISDSIKSHSALLSLIVAVSENGVIGRDNGMPWHLPSDLKRFRTITLAKPVIMGRKTYASIGSPLNGRTNIIITRSPDFDPDTGPDTGIVIAHSFEQARDLALDQAVKDGVDEIFIIGGAEIFKLALGMADRLYITEILASIDGDTFFPAFDRDLWQARTWEVPCQGEKDSHPTRFVIYERSKNLAR